MGVPPKIIYFNRIFPYKPSIFGVPHFSNPPYDSISIFRERPGMPADTFATIGQALSHHCERNTHVALRPFDALALFHGRGYETIIAQRREGGHSLFSGPWHLVSNVNVMKVKLSLDKKAIVVYLLSVFSATWPKKHWFLGSIISVTGMTSVLLAHEDQHHKPSTSINHPQFLEMVGIKIDQWP